MAELIPIAWLRGEHDGTHGCGSSCGGCLPSSAGLQCRAGITGEPCLAPELDGAPQEIRDVLAVLDREVLDPAAGCGIVAANWVKALRIADGEAELTLAFAPSGPAGRSLADEAFRTLCRLLPDTDVYVRHGA